MSKLTKIIAATFVPLVLATGCAKLKSIEEKENDDSISETLTGKLVLVEKLWPTEYKDDFCIVLETPDRKKHYCEANYNMGMNSIYRSIYRKAFYLLKDREDKGENMTVKGKSYDDVFDIKKIEIEGETIILPE